MSKGNLFLGFARGKVGDVVFSHVDGEQVARARNRSPKNPQTPLQLLQRVIVKTVSAAYSVLIDIADHSFQGAAEGTPNQSRFMSTNIATMRQRLAELINDGDPEAIVESTEANFNAKDVMMPLINSYVISEGHLPSVGLQFGVLAAGSETRAFHIPMPAIAGAAPTYAEVVSGLNLRQGDQLTFCVLIHDDSAAPSADGSIINGFEFARVILEPSDGDMTQAFLSTTVPGTVNLPNSRNEGAVSLAYSNGSLVVNGVGGINNWRGETSSIVGMAVIVSRQTGDVWARSTEQFLLVPSGPVDGSGSEFDYLTQYLGDAVLSFMPATMSSLYLNQADSGF